MWDCLCLSSVSATFSNPLCLSLFTLFFLSSTFGFSWGIICGFCFLCVPPGLLFISEMYFFLFLVVVFLCSITFWVFLILNYVLSCLMSFYSWKSFNLLWNSRLLHWASPRPPILWHAFMVYRDVILLLFFLLSYNLCMEFDLNTFVFHFYVKNSFLELLGGRV